MEIKTEDITLNPSLHGLISKLLNPKEFSLFINSHSSPPKQTIRLSLIPAYTIYKESKILSKTKKQNKKNKTSLDNNDNNNNNNENENIKGKDSLENDLENNATKKTEDNKENKNNKKDIKNEKELEKKAIRTYKENLESSIKKLTAAGIKLEPTPLSFIYPTYYVDTSTSVPIGASFPYLAGDYGIQSLSSTLPVLALCPVPGDFVLDLCSAPGNKSVQIAQFLNGKGTLLVNDISVKRMQPLKANLNRMLSAEQLFNVIMIGGYRSEFIGKVMSGKKADKILLDAPCSGSGIIAKDRSVAIRRNKEDVEQRAAMQKRMILAAVDSLKVGGILVYSTCSVLCEENEEVVNYVLGKRKVKVREAFDNEFFSFYERNFDSLGDGFGSEGSKKGKESKEEGLKEWFGEKGRVRNGEKVYSETMRKCKRFWPHVHGTFGFFVARIEKVGEVEVKVEGVRESKKKLSEDEFDEIYDDFYKFPSDGDDVKCDGELEDNKYTDWNVSSMEKNGKGKRKKKVRSNKKDKKDRIRKEK